jgi:hypothetical protein
MGIWPRCSCNFGVSLRASLTRGLSPIFQSFASQQVHGGAESLRARSRLCITLAAGIKRNSIAVSSA